MISSRRGFLGSLLSAAAFAVRPFAASAQSSPGPSLTPTPSPPDPRAEALVALARERYGPFLSPEEVPLLDERVRALERRGVRLRAVKLANGEEPAARFQTRRS